MASLYWDKEKRRWVVAWFEGGKRKKRLFPDQESARAFQASLSPQSETLSRSGAAFLARRSGLLSPSTLATYRRHLASWVAALGDPPLSAITAEQVSSCLETWAREGRHRSAQQRYRVLKLLLEEEGYGSVLERVAPPRYRPREWRIWTVGEARAFLERALADQRGCGKLLAFLLLTGLRLGEALALEWSDWADDRIFVTKALVWAGGSWHLTPAKTRAARRAVAVPPQAQAILASLPRRGERIFLTSRGTTPRQENIRRSLRRLIEAAGVRPLTVHDLRKVHASLALLGGADPRSVQHQLGHASPLLTLQVYSQAMAETVVARSVEKALRAFLGDEE